MIDLPKIRTFLMVAEHLSFTEAAIRLHCTQPTVSKQISVLEQEMGLHLFDRTKNQILLTVAGRLLYRELKQAVRLIDHGVELAKQCQSGRSFSLRIGIFEAFGTGTKLEALILLFLKYYQEVDVTFRINSAKELRAGLEDNSIDIAFLKQFDAKTNIELESRIVGFGTPSIVMSANNPLAAKEHVCLSELRDEPFVSIDNIESLGGNKNFRESCKKAGFAPNVIKWADNFRTLLVYVKAGIGVTICDREYLEGKADGLACYDLPDETPAANLLMWRHGNNNQAVYMLLNFLEENGLFDTCG